jgi:crotonobetainyl-CoA:carnitine CoA-transferase CaiB-like acyl-CoA transferase
MVGAFTNGFWRRLCEAVDHREWIEDPRFESNATRLTHRDELLGLLEEIFSTRTREEWLDVLERADVPNSPVLELDDAIVSEQAVHNKVVQRLDADGRSVDVIKNPITSDRWKPHVASMPPVMGEHTDEVLSELLGLDRRSIDDLVAAGVVARAQAEPS